MTFTQEVQMPKLSTNDIMTSPLTGQPMAPQQVAQAPATPAPSPEAPKGPARSRPEVWRTLRTPEGMRPSPRQQQRDARAYAEWWWQALREWEVHRGSMLVVGGEGGYSSGRQMIPVVGNWSGKPWGSVEYARLHTPLGWVAESAVARLCSADPLLSRVRGGAGLASLQDPRGGWNREKASALAYARAVLALAVALGDEVAETHLSQLQESPD